MDDFTQSHSLEVISFAPKYITQEVCRGLSELNYLYSVINSRNLATEQTEVRGEISVILLGKAQAKEPDSLLSHLNTPFLTIFCDSGNKWDHRIMHKSADYCSWPCKIHELDMRLKNVLSKLRECDIGCSRLMDRVEWMNHLLIGDCPEFLGIKSLIQRCAQCDASVLIEGETGTGKEAVARTIHSLSSRRAYPFVPVNCGALPDSLMENELFGHEKGAFTDAKYQQSGVISQADGGTLFLDEVECLSAKGQASLLRFSENQEFKPLGGRKLKKTNIRIITASNIPLSELIARKQFRQDLYFRLNLISLTLPALRERGKDKEVLAEHFMQKYGECYGQCRNLDHQTLKWIHHHHWPGNIRELDNYIHRLFLLNRKDATDKPTKSDKDDYFKDRRKTFDRRQTVDVDLPFKVAKNQMINRFEKRYLTHLIAKTQGNVTEAAKLAAMERRAFGKLLKKHGINKENYVS